MSEAIKEKYHQRKQKCFEHVLTHLKALTLSLEQLTIFSDESASQFKQRYLFKNLTLLAKQFLIALSWNFLRVVTGRVRLYGVLKISLKHEH